MHNAIVNFSSLRRSCYDLNSRLEPSLEKKQAVFRQVELDQAVKVICLKLVISVRNLVLSLASLPCTMIVTVVVIYFSSFSRLTMIRQTL